MDPVRRCGLCIVPAVVKLRRMILASLVGGMMFAAASAASAAASPRVCFYAQERNVLQGAYDRPRVRAATARRRAAKQQPQPDVRLLPKESKLLAITGGPGKIKNDSEHGWEWKLCKSVTDRELRQGRPPDLTGSGQDAPVQPRRVQLHRLGVQGRRRRRCEAAFGSGAGKRSIRPRGARQQVQGAVARAGWAQHPRRRRGVQEHGERLAQQCHRPALADDRPRLLHRHHAARVHRPAHDRPRTRYDRPHGVLPAETVGTGRRLRISLARLGTSRTVTEVKFGDGSRQYQRRTFAHSYRRAGTYRLRGIAIANATVYRFSLRVRVVRGGAAVSTATIVPHDAPHHYHFPQPAPVVWPLPI